MAPNDIREKLRRQPFLPIRVFVSDGAFYDVREAGDAAVSRMEMYIGVEPDEHGIPTRSVYIDPRHVTRIEFLGDERPNGEVRRA